MPLGRLVAIALQAMAFVCLMPASAALAQDRCIAFAHHHAPGLHRAALEPVKLAAGEVRISYVGHSTFLIETPKGVKIETDYNDYVRSGDLPDIATMNRAHDTHFSYAPDPRIRHVLRGWNPAGGAAEHDLTVEDVRIRNVPTNIRGWDGHTHEFGNSIFVFETARLCIAHLGHLHHTLTPQQVGRIGQMDIVLVPVDGSLTLDLDGMLEVLKALKARLMIPMHYFSRAGLERFLVRVRETFDVVESPVASIVVSSRTLPERPQVLVLPGR
ncbi:MAG TPA: MBL fold metallo-hydrolase [Hyphomicrobiaceae bacterium]|nr:MBL fold metallo-hydrolase [Hyphomicrobiaceae bacterium]